MPAASSAEPQLSLPARIHALWRTKLWLTVVISIGFWIPYLLLSRHAVLPIHTLPLTWLDEWAGFQPQPWSWVYESNFLITGIVPWLITTRNTLRRYALGFAFMSGVSFLCFLIFPVACPRPSELGTDSLLNVIARVDGPLNAFPSLHAASLIYTVLLVRRIFGRGLHPLVMPALITWGVLILFATLATKQHYAVDLLAGGIIGIFADWLVWRHCSASDSAADNKARSLGVTSQAGCK